jgi:hypothetical protein
MSTWLDRWGDRIDEYRKELKEGDCSTIGHRTEHRLRAFRQRTGRDPSNAELYAMDVWVAEWCTPDELAEGQRIRDSGELSFVFDTERSWDREHPEG